MWRKRLRHHPPPSPESKEVQVCQKQPKSIAKVLQRKQPSPANSSLAMHAWKGLGWCWSLTFLFLSLKPTALSAFNEPLPIAMFNQFVNDVSCHLTPAAGQCTLVSTGSTDPLKKDPTQLRIAAIYSSLSCGLSVWLDWQVWGNPTEPESPSADQNLTSWKSSINLRSRDILRGMLASWASCSNTRSPGAVCMSRPALLAGLPNGDTMRTSTKGKSPMRNATAYCTNPYHSHKLNKTNLMNCC